ncbi:MAG TPA: L-threonylcarbamoyladenylate synthase [Opitutaceae bacterium]|nr:L-threonylcarbamoyladenylate synthase [Opitutaceae bacterium]
MTPTRPTARIYRGTPRNLARLAQALIRGELVAVPTETVYGLAADALSPRACRRIFRAKGRPASDPLIVHIHAWRQLELLAEPNEAARRLAAAFWPGPLTLVLSKKPVVPAIVTAGLPSVAVRMPRHPLLQRLLKLCGRPLAAPSANPFGYVSPTTAEHVCLGLGAKIRYILEGGATPIGLESTIVDLRDPRKPRLLRPGAITREQLEKVLGCRVALARRPTPAPQGAQLAPGLLKRHYSPHTRVVLHATAAPADWLHAPSNEAWLLIMKPGQATPPNVHWLDARGNLRGVARRLFSQLRQLDAAGYRRIHVELAPGGGLAEAINDRLRRAAAAG